jgi:hypothetical protein
LEEKFAECGMKNRNCIPEDLSFERILDNHTMEPTSLRDFMNYLIYVAHDAENLQFFLWLRNYRKKFYALRMDEQKLSPFWTAPEGPPIEPSKSQMPPSSTQFTSVDSPRRMVSSEDFRLSEESTIKMKSMQEVVEDANVQAGLFWQPFSCQPFREEVTRMTATYIVPGAPRELNLSQRDRASVLHALQHTTHPSALDAAASVVEMTLRGQSHPNFVRWAIGNGTRPHTIFGRVLGAVVTLLGIATAVTLTLSSAPRWYRALAAIPFALGVFFVIGTRSGLCPLLYVLGHARELQPWEMRSGTSSPSAGSKITLFGSSKHRGDEEATLASSTTALSTLPSRSGRKVTSDDGSTYSRAMDPFGASNDFSAEDWVEPYRKKFFWMKIFSPMQRTKEKQVRLIRDRIFYQCAAWTAILTPVFAALFVAVPGGQRF